MKFKVLIFFVSLIFVLVSAQVLGSKDKPGSVTIDSCYTNGLTFTASGTFSDADGVSKVEIYSDDHYRGGNDYNNPASGRWSIENASVHNGYAGKSFTLKVVIIDSNGNTTSISRTCSP